MVVDNETRAIWAKSIALLEKTRRNVTQIDSSKFPTKSSEDARRILGIALEHLAKPENVAVVSPEVLYHQLISIQGLVDSLEASVNDRISWPLVSYCDEIRKRFFDDAQVRIFYSLTREHNYSITPYSSVLRSSLKDLLTKTQLDSIFSGPTIFRLSLASLEDDNLPLYANIGHEFGHALFYVRKSELAGMMVPHFAGVFKKAEEAWAQKPEAERNLMLQRLMRYFFFGPGEELYCDLLGALLMGPAFYLSLYEMCWGAKKNTWTGNVGRETGYPSLPFRLTLIRRWINLEEFTKEASKDFSKLETEALRNMTGFLMSIPIDHSLDEVRITDESESSSSNPFGIFIKDNLTEIKRAFAEFISDCHNRIQDEFKGKLPKFSSAHVADLLKRLECDILPNIIPDKTIYGKPAEFQDILNAAAMYRAALLLKTPVMPTIREDMQKIERLTSKALEVSYIQMKFKERPVANGNT